MTASDTTTDRKSPPESGQHEPERETGQGQALVRIRNLKKYFPVKGGLLRRTVAQLKAVDGVSLDLNQGRTLGLVGESGCGKSTLGRAALRLFEPTAGRVFVDGLEITRLSRSALKRSRRDMQMIFQDPYASLSPRRTVMQILLEPLDVHRIGDKSRRRQKVAELLETVGLSARVANRYPHEFSGGQRQRIGIARALALNPKFIVADEAVSALDVSVQAQVLNLIADLQSQFGIAFLFIAHDLAVVQHISHHVAVMYLGKIVETATADDLYREPKHPYTQALLSAVPQPEPGTDRKRIILAGDVPSPADPPTGCPFHPRCPSAMAVCSQRIPRTLTMNAVERRTVNCHLHDPEITPGATGQVVL